MFLLSSQQILDIVRTSKIIPLNLLTILQAHSSSSKYIKTTYWQHLWLVIIVPLSRYVECHSAHQVEPERRSFSPLLLRLTLRILYYVKNHAVKKKEQPVSD